MKGTAKDINVCLELNFIFVLQGNEKFPIYSEFPLQF